MSRWPRISIITACFNMVEHIAFTVESILNQGYPNIEYIIVDGGSQDGTLNVLKAYEGRISKIISEPDQGQYHAIQKGLDMASGEILAWLNADDLYMPWTLSLVGHIFNTFQTVDWLIGRQAWADGQGHCVGVAGNVPGYPQRFIQNGWFRPHLGGYLQQESMFWRRSLWEKSGGLDLSLKYAADFKLWTQFARETDLVSVSVPLALFKCRPGEQRSSAGRDQYEHEVNQICEQLPKPPVLWDRIGRRGKTYRCLWRFGKWRKARALAHSPEKDAWILKRLWLPVSLASLTGLLLENAVRRAGDNEAIV